MATSTFQLYIDKENATVPLKHTGSGQGLGVRGVGLTPNVKTFAGRDSSLSRSGPRSALRDVNSVLPQAPLKNQSLKDRLAPSQQLFKKPAPRDDLPLQRKSEKHQKSKTPSTVEGKHRVIHKAPELLPDIESMHISNDSDTRPKIDPDYIGVIGKLRRWKPPCFFGGHHDSDSEDEVVDEVVDLAPPEQHFDLEDIDLEPVDFDIDIPIPNIDKDLPIPFLDDTIDIEPNLGTLEIYDSSTPLNRSLCAKQ